MGIRVGMILLLVCSALRSQNNWTWMQGSSTATNVLPAYGTQGVSSATTTPGTLYASTTWTDNAGNLWLFGGYSSTGGLRNDLWKYNTGTNQWTWVKGPGLSNQYGAYGSLGVASASNNPGGRYLAQSWTDNNGNFWLFSGYGYSETYYGYLNDLWKYDPSINQWTWMKGPKINDNFGVYGTMGTASSTNEPGGRQAAATFKDNAGNLWMFGGFGWGASAQGELSDMWRYNISTNNWTWMSGATATNVPGSYGTQGVASTTNNPGGRRGSMSWTDNSGNFWMFGGYGTIASSTLALANDLWKYTPSTNSWMWVRGSNQGGSFGWYGSMGIAASNNDPGSRYYAGSGFVDNIGDLWLFGGWGYSASSASLLNDLWRYNITTDQWTWMRGASSPNQQGSYGTMGTPSATNNPGARYLPVTWCDHLGKIWSYGGYGFNSTSYGELTDMWRFDICIAPQSPTITTPASNLSVCSGNSVTISATGGTNTIRWYASQASASVIATGSVFTTPVLQAVGSPTVYSYYAETFSCSSSGSRTAVHVTVHPTPTITVNSGTTCVGGVFVMIPSGAASYSYTGGSQVVFPSANSSYTVTGTSAQGCTATAPAVASVTVYPSPVITVNSGTLCAGNPFIISPSGAASYTFSGGSATVSPSTTTFYIVTGTSSLGCISLAPAIANVLVFPTPTIAVSGASICAGETFTLNPSGAASYTFSGGLSVVSPSSTTSYTVSGTSSLGCVSSAVATVTVSALPVISLSGGVICNGSSFTLSPSGAATYTYSNGGPVVSPTITTSYTVNGTSAAGCAASLPAVAAVSVQNNPVVTVTGGTICLGGSFTFSPSGAASYSYSGGSSVVSPSSTTAYFVSGITGSCVSTPVSVTVVVTNTLMISVNSGSICSGETFTISPSGASSYTFSGGGAVVSPAAGTSYTVTGTTGAGCISLPAISTVTVHSRPAVTVNSGAICSGNSFTISPNGAASYTISGGSAIVSPIVNTNYSVSGTSSAGCIAASVAISGVTVHAVPVITVNSGSVCAGDVFTLMPSGAASYTVSGGTMTVSPAVTSTYSVVGTGSAGCTATAAAVSTVVVNPIPVISVNSGTICAGNAFTITPAGAAGYTYSGGSSVVSPTVTTQYTVAGSGGNGCISAPVISTVIVTNTLSISVPGGTICEGASFTLVPAGASSYTFSGGTAVVSPATTTAYTVTGTSAGGCLALPATAVVSVTARPLVSLAGGSICAGGVFTLSPAGAASYTFSSGSPVVSPAVSSTYAVTGSGPSGCISLPVVATVAVHALPVISVNSGSVCSGSPFVMLPSGANTYTFSSGSATVSPAISSTYAVAGTSSAGCVSAAAALSSVTVHSLPVITVNSGTVCAGNVFTVSPSGAASYSYSSGSPLISSAVSTVVTVLGSSGAGCVSSPATSTITVIGLPVISVNSGSICAGSSFVLSPSGAASFTFQGGSPTVTPGSSTTYSIAGTGTSGCVSAPVNATVVVHSLPVITVNSGTICAGNSFTLIPAGAASYSFSGGSAVVAPLNTTTFAVTGTGSTGCVAQVPALSTVFVNSNPVISVNSGTVCAGSFFTINPSGANSYSYSSGSAVLAPGVSTVINVTGTSSAGCISQPVQASITVIAAPVVSVNSGSVCAGTPFVLIPSGAASYTVQGGTTTVTPQSTSSYSVSGTNTAGCVSAPAVATVTVHAIPVLTVNSGSICAGGTFVIIPSGASTYSVSGGSATVSPLSSTFYSVSGTSAAGCTSTTQAISSVTVHALPVVTVSGGTVCAGQSFTLLPAGADSYSYSTGQVVTPAVNTTYSVTGFSNAGCTSTTPALASVSVVSLPVITVNSGTICAGDQFVISPSGASSYTIQGGSATVTPSGNSTFTVTGTSTAGCISAIPAVVSVTVHALPIVAVNSGTVCDGQSFTIVPSGASVYTITGGAPVVTPSTTTSYSVTGTSTAGCISASAAVSTVTVHALPVITVNSGTICYSGTFSINPAGAASYTISGGQAVVSPTISTTYSVTGTGTNGCISNAAAVSSVIVNNNLTISVSGGTICEGESFTLAPSGANSFTFSGGGPVVSPTITSTYSVTGSSAGCLATSAAVATVIVNPLPVIAVNSGTICLGESFAISPSGAATYTVSGGSLTVSPSGNAQYTIAGTDLQGCVSKTEIASVTVNPLPVINVSGTTLCAGDSFTLMPTGAVSYSFINGGPVVSPSASTQYSVSGSSADGCVSASPGTADVIVNPIPVLSPVSTAVILCAGETATLSVSGAATYSWSLAGSTVANSATLIVTATTPATYHVRGQSSEGCVSDESVALTVSDCLGLSAQQVAGNISVYPNPSDGVFYVDVAATATIEVFNDLGQVILHETLSGTHNRIDLGTHARGLYQIKVSHGVQQFVCRIIRY